MNKFKNLTIPEGITFRERVREDDVGDKKTPCSWVTNGWFLYNHCNGVIGLRQGCRGLSCYDCIFSKVNNKERLEYFKEVTKR